MLWATREGTWCSLLILLISLWIVFSWTVYFLTSKHSLLLELYLSHQICIYTISTTTFTCLLTTVTCTLSMVRTSSSEGMYGWLRITTYSSLSSEKSRFFFHPQLQLTTIRYLVIEAKAYDSSGSFRIMWGGSCQGKSDRLTTWP